MSFWLMLKGMINPKWEEELVQKKADELVRMVMVKVGDRVRYTGESVTNGTVYQVTEVAEHGVVVEINGGPFMIPPDKFERA